MKRLFALLLGLLFTASVSAQVTLRTIPADAKRGKLTARTFPEVTIDGKSLRLAPGGRILNQNNLTVTPNQVAPDTLVRYRLNAQGQVDTIWMLTPAEAARK